MSRASLRGQRTGALCSAGGTSGYSGAMGKKTGGGCERPLNGLEQRSSTTVSTILMWIGWIAATFVQFVCVLFIRQYDASHSDIRSHPPPPPPPPPVSNPSNDTPSLWRLPFQRGIFRPSTPFFTNAVMIYGSAVLVCYNLRKSDSYQDHILLLGILGGAVLYVYNAVYEGNIVGFKDIMPAVISLSLVLSVCVHQALR
ncbi:hypothetical protein BKA65DRAFT_111586 [Rhexocercosporidium sp. MPI-PUGE-AT-0058]|nr:hypothetical protein BKA65DRAFT_111586 [Rhexocercosporidium sp. MPI-PUGE-AT-0058]